MKSLNKEVWEIINEPFNETSSKTRSQTRLDRLEKAALVIASKVDNLLNEFL